MDPKNATDLSILVQNITRSGTSNGPKNLTDLIDAINDVNTTKINKLIDLILATMDDY